MTGHVFLSSIFLARLFWQRRSENSADLLTLKDSA
jgi:hypothetical protein